MHQRSQSVSRRTVAKGAAWSLPAVAIAASAPSLAASTSCTDEMQILTQTFDISVGSSGTSLPGSATLSIQVPTCVSPGDIIVPTLTGTVTAAGFDEVYSGEGLTGDFEFFYDVSVPGDPQGYRFWTDDLVLHRDDTGLGIRISGQGEPITVPGATGELVVGTNPFGLDTFFGDYERSYYANGFADAPVLGTISVA